MSRQKSESLMLNMFSLHCLYVDVINDLERILRSKDRDDFIITDLTDRQCQIFIHAVKHYLNHQPDFFEQCTKKRSYNGQHEDDDCQKRKQEGILQAAERRRVKEEALSKVKSEEDNQTKPFVIQSQFFDDFVQRIEREAKEEKEERGEKEEKQKELQTQDKNDKKTLDVKQEEHSSLGQPESHQKEGSEAEESDDLQYYQDIKRNNKIKNYQTNLLKVRTPKLEDIKNPYYQPKRYDHLLSHQNELSFDQVWAGQIEKYDFYKKPRKERIKYNQQALTKTSCIVFGSYRPGGLKYKTKLNEVSIHMNDCFLKMRSNGRDAYLERLQVKVVKIEDDQVQL